MIVQASSKDPITKELDRAFSFMQPDKSGMYSGQKKICPVCNSDNSADNLVSMGKCVNCRYSLAKVKITRV